MKKRKIGFTVVELVIVIAVIAVLAAVLIPTFGRVIKNAGISTDIQLVKNLNQAVAIEKAESGKEVYATAHDAVDACVRGGYVADLIATRSGYDIAWSRNSGDFVLLDSSENAVIFPSADGKPESIPDEDRINYFIVRTRLPKEGSSDSFYSVYAGKGWDAEENAMAEGKNIITVAVGFDAGGNTAIKQINYIRQDAADAQSVIIRSCSSDTVVTVNAEKDTVDHYGTANRVIVEKVALKDCYTEYGSILGNISLKQGSVIVEKGCTAAAVVIDLTSSELADIHTISASNENASYVPIILHTTRSAWAENTNNGLIDPNRNSIIYAVPDSSSTVVKEPGREDASVETAAAYSGVSGKYYMNLDMALDAAADNETVYLLSDGQQLFKDLHDGDVKLLNKKGVTLDLNGKTLKWTKGVWLTGAEGLTIRNGTLKGVTDGQSYSCFFGDEAPTSVLLSNINGIGGFNFYNTKASIVGCNIVLNAGYNAIWADEGSDVSIESGLYDASRRTVGKGIIGCSDSLLKISGGTFISNDPDILLSTSEYKEGEYKSGLKGIIITGGCFNVNISDFTFILKGDDGATTYNQKLLADGFTLKKSGSYWMVSK